LKVEKARLADVPQMQQMVNAFAEKGEMLARPLSEMYENIRDYFVIRGGDKIIACVALHVCWEDLAEIKSLAVTQENQRQGIGAQLIKACVQEATKLGIPTVFCLTYKPKFFETLGFTQIDRMQLPRKVWTECYRCSKFPDCDEIALTYHIRTPAKTTAGLKSSIRTAL
jgi:amino-acid N-acetyltransferase